MDWCVHSLINTYLNKSLPSREKLKAKLLKTIKTPKPFEFYQRLKVYKENNEWVAMPLTWDDRIPTMLVEANALFISPIGKSVFEKGDIIEAEILHRDLL